MLYASSVRALKATLGLESLLQVQASELSDIDEKAIKHEVSELFFVMSSKLRYQIFCQLTANF